MADNGQAPAPNPEGAQPSCGCSASVELAALREKTQTWKKAVKTQLDDAQQKNQTLRDEVKKLQEKLATVGAETRLQLNSEFKDRLAIKDDEILHYKQEVEKARAERTSQTKDHIQQLARLEADMKAQLASVTDEAKRSHEVLKLQLSTEQHRSEELQKLLEAEGAKVADLEKKLEANKKESAETAELAEKKHAEALQNQAAGVPPPQPAARPRTPLAPPVDLEFYIEREQQLSSHLRQKEEQLIVFQQTISALQEERNRLQQAVGQHKEKMSEVDDKYAQKLSKLTSELLHKHEELGDLRRKLQDSSTEVEILRNKCEELKAEAQVREAAFDQWFHSEGESGTVLRLEGELRSASSKMSELTAALSQAEERVVTLEETKAASEAQLAAKATELSSLQSSIEQKTERLRQQEERIRQKQKELAEQASSLLNQQRARDGEAPSSGTGSDGDVGSSVGGSAIFVGANDRLSGSGNGFVDMDAVVGAMSRQWMHWRKVLAQQQAAGNVLVRYRRYAPVAIVVLILLVGWFWLAAGTSTAGGKINSTLSVAANFEEQLELMRREYGLLNSKYVELSARCPAPPR